MNKLFEIWRTRRKLVLILLAVVVGWMFLWSLQRSGQKATEVQEALDESLEGKGIVSVSGNVAPIRQAKLGFARPGKLKIVAVQVGDSVRAGQTLIELENADLKADVEAAEAALSLAKAQLAQVEPGSREEELESARAAYRAAVAKYEQVTSGASEAEIESATAAVEAARERLSQAEASTSTQEKVAEAKLEAAQARLKQLQEGASAEDIRAAELQLEQARNTLWATQIERDGIKGNPANPEFMGQAGDAKVAAAETAVKIAEANLLKLKAGASEEEMRIAKAAVTQAEAELAAVRNTKEATLQSATSALRSAEARLAQLKRGATAEERDIAASNVASAKAALDLRTSGPAAPEIEAARARVRQAEGMLNRAKAELEQTTLKAPFDGIVASVAANEGEVVTPGNALVVLGDITAFKIETLDLRETSVAKVRVGQSAEITLDAFPEKILRGKVTRIAPMATTGVGGTNYAATIELDEQDPAMRWGMTANINIDVR